ncbi:MAG: hypothetical protein QME75_00625 [Deltaproteobacteria bacterium]|nr:hypothetical protein [Deltaproteobacteria bacterium]
MKKPGVVVVAGDRQDGKKFCSLLTDLNYVAALIHHPDDLEGFIKKSPNVAVIFDLDTVRPDKQFFRGLKKKHPRLFILGVSSQAYHPGLEEVIGSHLYACLMKPVDMEELGFWLKSISENLVENETIIEG